ncbi:MAG: response regulator [Desulfobacterales bacterium]|nr:response regulator [Desulfobacterales bacterium]
MPKQSPKILIVCDELETRLFLSNLLQRKGFSTLDAEDEAGGIHLAGSESPALIILDMMMRGDGSIHIYRFLKQHGQLRKVPVLMLSAIDPARLLTYLQLQGKAWGWTVPQPEAFLEKPIETDKLLGQVCKWTKRRPK